MPRSSGNVRLFVARIRDILRVTGPISDVVPLRLEFSERWHWWQSGRRAIYVPGLGSKHALGEIVSTCFLIPHVLT